MHSLESSQKDSRKEIELKEILLSRAEAEIERLAQENADLLLAGSIQFFCSTANF
jgi:hypothetical protein